MAHAPPLPPQFADFLKIPKLISSGVVKLDFRIRVANSRRRCTPPTPNRPRNCKQLIERGLAMGRQMALAKIARGTGPRQ